MLCTAQTAQTWTLEKWDEWLRESAFTPKSSGEGESQSSPFSSPLDLLSPPSPSSSTLRSNLMHFRPSFLPSSSWSPPPSYSSPSGLGHSPGRSLQALLRREGVEAAVQVHRYVHTHILVRSTPTPFKHEIIVTFLSYAMQGSTISVGFTFWGF